MLNTLKNYIYNIEDPQSNFDLALEYDALGQSYTAISYYLRTANLTQDQILAYTCILKIGTWFVKHECRNFSAETMLQQAVALQPKRPEAYFLLSQLYEKNKKYLESYQLSTVGLEVCDFDSEPLSIDVGYVGKWGLIFERAITAWHCGKEDLTRELLRLLVDKYWNELSESYKNTVEFNITSLGCGHIFSHRYTKELYPGLNYKFPGSENINENFSQVYQDMFVLFMLDGKRNGTFLEVGGSLPYHGNNTALLERDFNACSNAIACVSINTFLCLLITVISSQCNILGNWNCKTSTNLTCITSFNTFVFNVSTTNFSSQCVTFKRVKVVSAN